MFQLCPLRVNLCPFCRVTPNVYIVKFIFTLPGPARLPELPCLLRRRIRPRAVHAEHIEAVRSA
jgi:hypothetical protein